MGRDVISSETSFTMQISEPMADKELYHILNPKDDCWAQTIFPTSSPVL